MPKKDIAFSLQRATFAPRQSFDWNAISSAPANVVCQEIRRTGENIPNPDVVGGTYTRSALDERPKFTEGAVRCICTFLVGTRRRDLQEVSALTHVTPDGFFRRGRFLQVAYPELLDQFADETIPGSQVAVIAGGETLPHLFAITDPRSPFDSTRYKNARNRLISLHRQKLGIKSIVLPPKNALIWNGETNLYGDTTERTLYVTETVKRKKANPVFQPVTVGRLRR